MTIKSDIAELLKKNPDRLQPLLYKNEKEKAFLESWLATPPLTKEASLSGKELMPADPFEMIRMMIDSCHSCSSVVEKKYGIGDGSNGVMIILNSPKLVNRVEKDIYRQDSIDLLKKIVDAIDLEFQECYISNLVKCEIDDPLAKPSQLVVNCSHIIDKELELFTPRIVIVMGDIIPLQKSIKESGDIVWYNIEHPITLLKNPELKRNAWNTLKLAMASIHGNSE